MNDFGTRGPRNPDDEIRAVAQSGGRVFRTLYPYVILVAVVFWIVSGIFIVPPDSVGVVRRFGQYTEPVRPPGPHYRIPWPIDDVDVVSVLAVRRTEVGFRTIRPGPPAEIQSVPEEALMLTGDENIVDAQVIVQYRITDPARYLFRVLNADRMLKEASEASLRQVMGRSKVDDALTVGRGQIQIETQDLLQRMLDNNESGLQVLEVRLREVLPPQQVQGSFKDVVSALEDRSRLENEAQGYQEDILPKARGQAQVILREAEAYREQRVRIAKGDADRFTSILKEYLLAKDVTRQRMYLETIEQVLPTIRKYVLDSKTGGNLLQLLPLDAGASSSSATTPAKPAPAPSPAPQGGR